MNSCHYDINPGETLALDTYINDNNFFIPWKIKNNYQFRYEWLGKIDMYLATSKSMDLCDLQIAIMQ